MSEQEKYLNDAGINYHRALEIMETKSCDYAQITDPFANFRACEVLGIDLKRGILVRMMDKLVRINNLIDREAKVKDESIEDTLLDLMNYTNIVLMKVQSERKVENVD